MHKSATKCNETLGKWCKNKHGASKIIDTFETYQSSFRILNLLQASLKSLMTVEGLNVPGSPISLSYENLYHNAAETG
jgi:hypothetical protein